MIGSSPHGAWATGKFAGDGVGMLYRVWDNGGWQPRESGS